MKREAGIKWLFMDLNSYFASVEQQENPLLRGKPVAVVPMDTDYTCAIAASYEAKAYGVKTGTMIEDAKRMCPKLHCTIAQHDKYVAYHNRIIEEVIKHTPINKIWSIDELSSRLPPSKRNIESAQKISHDIKKGLWKNVGEVINCSIGFAPNSLLAKIAGSMQKPDGLTIIRQEDLPGPLLDLNLTDLPGIGANMERRLHRAGIMSVEDFWDISPKHARKIWGNVQGERFWYLIHGYDIEAPQENASVIGHSRILDPELREPEKARLIAQKLTIKAAQRLRNKLYFARTITLSIRTKNDNKWSESNHLPAAQDPFTLLGHLDVLWEKMISRHHGERIKKVSITLHNLIQQNMITDDIFLSRTEDGLKKTEKNNALTKAMDKLQHKYKKDVVSLGICPQTSAGFVGTKIAFSRVPKTEEFWE